MLEGLFLTDHTVFVVMDLERRSIEIVTGNTGTSRQPSLRVDD